MTMWSSNDEVPEKESEYNIQVLEVNCEVEVTKNKKLPRNSYTVSYTENSVVHNDIVVGDMANIFDCYYDSLGKGSIQSIKYTDGQVPAKLFDKKKYLNSNRGTKEEKK